MAQRLILHVGAPKTGTTYLQDLLWGNAGVLAGQGVHLPLGDSQALRSAAADLRQAPWSSDWKQATWQDLAAAVDEVEGTVVVSEELLCRTPPERIDPFLAALAPGTVVDVVFGARDHGRQVPAMWQHAVRGRNTVTFDGYLQWLRGDPQASYWLEQDPVLAHDRWGRFVPPERFHVLTVPASGSSPSLLWERFASILGVDARSVQPPAAPANESLGVAEAEVLRRLNDRLGDRFPLWHKYVTVVRRHVIVPALATAPAPERIRVPADAVPWLEEHARSTVAELLNRGVHVAGDPEELCLPIEPASLTPTDLTEGQLLDAVLDAWVRQLEHLDATRRDQPPGPPTSLAQRVARRARQSIRRAR